jgi:hypothetical protein
MLQGVSRTVGPGGSDRAQVGRTVREESTDSLPSWDRPEVRLGPSFFQGAVLEVLLLFLNYLLEGRGPSA